MKAYTALGLMSGTSADGVDASIIETDGEKVISFGKNHYKPYTQEIKDKILALYNLKQSAEKEFIEEVERQVTEFHAVAVNELLASLSPEDKRPEVIGFHGHTIDHQPHNGYTWQIGDGKLLAKMTNINVVYDFRTNDVKNGGQGAPVLPIYHKAIISDEYYPLCVLNIGGVSNITYIDHTDLIAFDTGPGNALVDDFLRQEGRYQFDEGGRFAMQGKPDDAFIKGILNHEFFSAKYPKSLDRNEFRNAVFDKMHEPENPYLRTRSTFFYDKVATIAELTVQSIVKGIEMLPKKPKHMFFCGGGAKNFYFLKRMSEILHETKVQPISSVNENLDTDFIESQGFAFLAVRSLLNKPITYASTTGVKTSSATGGVLCKI